MITIKEILEMLGNIANLPRIHEVEGFICMLKQENEELKAQLRELKLKLDKTQKWPRTKKFYQKTKTKKNYIVYRFLKDTLPDIYYCPVCIDKECTPIILQPSGKGIYCPVCKTSYMK